ncbi:hypothetical protein NNJEOMEG_03966 [Fundidesulfovibrio magnetotacticus]|uniref:NADPH-dependent FMN reductase-like domain-containing protein n=1 Tax=Fundidesulfovibrio magnetotacticus TaxID=2730080 RepID=A0A6V8LUE8_9BACT|nr:hypothetical protein NNJEOMEG_03966 [Fundidesulfovibrio magnetotacticus]
MEQLFRKLAALDPLHGLTREVMEFYTEGLPPSAQKALERLFQRCPNEALEFTKEMRAISEKVVRKRHARKQARTRDAADPALPVDESPRSGKYLPMRTVLLDGTPAGNDACRQGADALRRALSDAGHAVEAFPLAELPIAPCRGCFACWTASPGRCPFQDASQSVAAAVANARLAVFYADMRFGVWGYELKKALDRMICLISPHFKVGAPTRHARRYPRMPAILSVGWLPAPDPESAEIFGRVVGHNARNMGAPAWRAVVLPGDASWAAHRQLCLDALARLAA